MQKPKRKLYFRVLKKLMKIKYKKPNFVYLGEPVKEGAIILSNHEGTDAPMALEIYHPAPIRMWGASEMNSGLKQLYKYQTRIYYHEKKHWNIHLARLFCLVASPLTDLFYKGFDLISSYRDGRLIKTIRESVASIKEGYNVVIFPEDSTKGYLEQLEGFHGGFTLLCKSCEKKGMQTPLYLAYYRKSDNTYIFDKPIYYSDLAAEGYTDEQIPQILCDRCNALRFVNANDETKTATEAVDAKAIANDSDEVAAANE